jgi:hypothetical protein
MERGIVHLHAPPARPEKTESRTVKRNTPFRKRNIRAAGNGHSVCTDKRNIGTASDRSGKRYISRLPYPAPAEAGIQGSSTVRAPLKAGSAGSSPAPVASLTEMMLEMVAKLSPEVRMLALGLKP